MLIAISFFVKNDDFKKEIRVLDFLLGVFLQKKQKKLLQTFDKRVVNSYN